MTQTYRTTDSGKWGVGKGSRLTASEVDNNFWDALERIVALEALPGQPAEIDYFEVSGTSFYVHLTDATTLGPYELPVAVFRATGEWLPSHVYSVLDTFTENGALYYVTFAHTSGLTFDAGANDGLGHDYYALMLDTPGNSLPTGGAAGQILTKSTSGDFLVTWTWKLPTGGTAGQYVRKINGTQDNAEWSNVLAEDVEFTPVTGSPYSSSNVADALEEVAGMIPGSDASDVTYTPSTDSGFDSGTITRVDEALNYIGANFDPRGKQTIWVPASAMRAAITSGPESVSLETSTHKINYATLNFDSSGQEYAFFDAAMPKSWDGGDVFFQFFWSHDATTTNFGVTWNVEGNDVSNGQVLDTPLSGPVAVSDTGGTTNVLYVSDASSGLSTLAVADAIVVFRISRDPTDGSDNMAVDARLHGVKIFYVTDAPTDD